MDKVLKKAESFSYSDSDIKRFLDDDVVIRKYPELEKYKTLDDILVGEDGKSRSCAIILYMIKHNFGHWTALIKDPGDEKGTYEVFDSYGIMPDDELKYVPEDFKNTKEGSKQDNMFMSNIIKSDLESGKVSSVYYNKVKLQKSIKDINTCGRWCAVRCLLKRFRIDEFCLLFLDQTLEPDAYVTMLTLMNK